MYVDVYVSISVTLVFCSFSHQLHLVCFLARENKHSKFIFDVFTEKFAVYYRLYSCFCEQVVPAELYACVTWVLSSMKPQSLFSFENRRMNSFTNKTEQKKVRNEYNRILRVPQKSSNCHIHMSPVNCRYSREVN